MLTIALAALMLTSGLPAQTLTPQQQAYRAFEAKREQLRAQAKQTFDTEIEREKAGDCPKAETTVDFNTCFGNAVTIADQHLKTYEETLAALRALHESGELPSPDAAAFSHLEQLWHSYLEAASAAALRQFDGGTGGPSFELETHLRLVRNHLRELNTLYGIPLRL